MVEENKKIMIEVKDLWKAYGTNQVLKGLSIQVYEGETLVILGRSGVGKSVLLRQLIGLEPSDKGSLFIAGHDITSTVGPDRLKSLQMIGMLFQGSALFDSMTVAENVGFYLTENGDPRKNGEPVSTDEIKKRVEEALEHVGLAGVGEKMPADLSGGMKKRAALARLIVYHPFIFLYDEPTTGLDPITAMQINNLIRQTQKDLNATSIVVTHDLRSAFTVGDRLAMHYDGKIIFIGDKISFIKNENPLIRAFLADATLRERELEP